MNSCSIRVRRTMRTGELVALIIKYLVIAVILAVLLFAILIMVIKAFTSADWMDAPRIFPKYLSTEAFSQAFESNLIGLLGNTLIIGALNVVGTVFSSSLCAYGFAKLKFKGREVVFFMVLATLMLPSVCMQLQLYSLYYSFNWIGTWFPLIIPAFCGGGAINIFLTRQFMRGVPNSVCEAAKIDGANKLTTYLNIMIPMCMPIVCYIGVTTFFGCWNDLMGPLLYLADNENLYTISVMMYKLMNDTSSLWQRINVQMAAGIIMMIPCLILFLIFQKTLINGVTVGGVKG